LKPAVENSLDVYLIRIEDLFKKGYYFQTSSTSLKCRKRYSEGFINRDLANSQYIAKYAKTMLGELVKFVVSTTGSITDRLREDWQLVDVMKELNWEKYKSLGLTKKLQMKRAANQKN
jgi:CRISPR-associated endonuclease Csn1